MDELKLSKLKLDGVELPDYNITRKIVMETTDRLIAKFDTYIIDGLKRKGFEFDDKKELEKFAKEHCSCEDNPDLKEKIYRVNDVPFLLHKYGNEWDLTPITKDNKTTFTASYGAVAYL